MHVGGQSEELDSSVKSLMFALGLAIFLVYLVMASQFESLLHPFVIMFSIPLAAVGAVLALKLTNSPVSVVVFIGLIMLVGIVVKNAIVLIDRVNQLREAGVAKRDAIAQGAESRLRPIVMTTLCTLIGFSPLAIGVGEGAEVRAPMAITVIGGLRGLDAADAGRDPGRLRPARSARRRMVSRARRAPSRESDAQVAARRHQRR